MSHNVKITLLANSITPDQVEATLKEALYWPAEDAVILIHELEKRPEIKSALLKTMVYRDIWLKKFSDYL